MIKFPAPIGTLRLHFFIIKFKLGQRN